MPQHRPGFDQILQILKTDTFTHLLAATSITKDNNEITAASLHAVAVRRNSMSSFYSKSNTSIMAMITQSVGSGMEMSASYTGVMSLIYGNATGGQGEETANQVWYGTDTGQCGIIKFEKSRTDREVYGSIIIVII